MKFLLVIGLVLALTLVGCIQMDTKHDIRSDGTDFMEITIYRTGMLVNADCKTIKSYARSMSSNLSKADLDAIVSAPCHETDSTVVLNGVKSITNNPNVREIEKDGRVVFRYEENASMFVETTVKMPSKVLEHNGELIDSQTVKFARGSVGLMDTKTNYVEAEKPKSTCCVPIALIGFVMLAAFVRRE